MAKQNVVEQIFSPIGQGIRGMARGLFPGAAKAADLDTQRIQALLDSEAGRRFVQEAQKKWYNARADFYNKGGTGGGVDNYVKGADDLGKIRQAKDKFIEEEMTPETAAYFEEAEKSVLNRMKSAPSDYFGPRDEIEMFEELSKGRKQKDKTISPSGPRDEIEMFEQLSKKKKYEAPTEWLRTGEVPGVKEEKKGKILADYFQAPTDTVPEGNVPKTFPQLGITNVDDQAIIQEMQKALPDVDMRDEYEADPEMMKKLMELWKAKKLTKQNIHKAFSNIQQNAQQALGIR